MLTAILIVLILIFLLMFLGRDGFALASLGAMGCLWQLIKIAFFLIVGLIILVLILNN